MPKPQNPLIMYNYDQIRSAILTLFLSKESVFENTFKNFGITQQKDIFELPEKPDLTKPNEFHPNTLELASNLVTDIDDLPGDEYSPIYLKFKREYDELDMVHLPETLVDFLKQCQEKLLSEDGPLFIDILPTVRKYYKDERFQLLMDQAIQWDLPCLTFHGGHDGLFAQGTHLNAGTEYVGDYEYDTVRFHAEFKKDGPSWYIVEKHLAIIMLSDCTGCCNALEYIRLSSTGILAYGNVSGTYHS